MASQQNRSLVYCGPRVCLASTVCLELAFRVEFFKQLIKDWLTGNLSFVNTRRAFFGQRSGVRVGTGEDGDAEDTVSN